MKNNALGVFILLIELSAIAYLYFLGRWVEATAIGLIFIMVAGISIWIDEIKDELRELRLDHEELKKISHAQFRELNKRVFQNGSPGMYQ